MNIAIKSLVREGDHVLISDIEHNSVLRPIFSLNKSRKIEYSVFESAFAERSIKENIKPNTRFIVSTLASNVTGAEIPIELLSRIARENNLGLIVDASQIAGHKKIDLKRTPCDVLCAPGHKALFGIEGAGFLIFNTDIYPETLIEGGSGNLSVSPSMPESLPERLEAGTLPCPSIVSLNEGVKFIEGVGVEAIENKLTALSNILYERLSSLPYVRVYGVGAGIISFNISSLPSELAAGEMNQDGICVRAGLHCAPSAHKLLGTLSSGTVRASLSYFNKRGDIDALYKSVKGIFSKYY